MSSIIFFALNITGKVSCFLQRVSFAALLFTGLPKMLKSFEIQLLLYKIVDQINVQNNAEVKNVMLLGEKTYV